MNTALRLSEAAFDCLSMFAFVCAHNDSALLTCCIYQVIIGVFGVRVEGGSGGNQQ